MAKPWIYADTSAFLKLFIKEPGTDRMRRLAREHRLLSFAVVAVETVRPWPRVEGTWRSATPILSASLLA